MWSYEVRLERELDVTRLRLGKKRRTNRIKRPRRLQRTRWSWRIMVAHLTGFSIQRSVRTSSENPSTEIRMERRTNLNVFSSSWDQITQVGATCTYHPCFHETTSGLLCQKINSDRVTFHKTTRACRLLCCSTCSVHASTRFEQIHSFDRGEMFYESCPDFTGCEKRANIEDSPLTCVWLTPTISIPSPEPKNNVLPPIAMQLMCLSDRRHDWTWPCSLNTLRISAPMTTNSANKWAKKRGYAIT